MTTAELLTTLTQRYPNGVSFDPMSLRLLRQKMPIEDWQVEVLKKSMFQWEEGIERALWFTTDMVIEPLGESSLQKQAHMWLAEFGYFSIDSLVDIYGAHFKASSFVEAPYHLFRHMGFTVTGWKQHFFCVKPNIIVSSHLRSVSQVINQWISDRNGIMPCYEISNQLPHVSLDVLETLRLNYLPEVNRITEGALECWRHPEYITVPDDFSDQITDIVDTLLSLEEKPSISNLSFALNLFYRVHFRQDYALVDDKIFLRVCQKHYQGDSSVLTGTRARQPAEKDKRTRSVNTCFVDIDVPIGATLMFSRDVRLTCKVANESNGVMYNGTIWPISTLANHLTGKRYLNGFDYFMFDGESLFSRRKRMEEKGQLGTSQCTSLPLLEKVPPTAHDISLPFSFAPQPCIDPPSINEAALQEDTEIEKDKLHEEKMENSSAKAYAPPIYPIVNTPSRDSIAKPEEIARSEGYEVATIKRKISNHQLYDKVYEKNGILTSNNRNTSAPQKTSPIDPPCSPHKDIRPDTLDLEKQAKAATGTRAFAQFKHEFADIAVRRNVAEWVRRVDAGEEISTIAKEFNYTHAAVKNLIKKYRLCMQNIADHTVQGAGTDV